MGNDQTAENVFLVLSYVFIVLMILVCVIAAGLVWRWLSGMPKRLGTSGFAIIGLSAFLQLLRNLMYTFVLSGSGNYNSNLVNLLDLFTAFMRLFGVIVVAAGLLSVARDLGALFSGKQVAPTGPVTAALPEQTPGTLPPQTASTQYLNAPQAPQTSSTQYLHGSQQPMHQPSAQPPMHQPSAQQPPQGWGTQH